MKIEPQYYDEILAAIEIELSKVLAQEINLAWFTRFFSQLETIPNKLDAANLNLPARDLVFRGGKRWRPLIIVVLAEILGMKDAGLKLCPLIELAHNGSLIIDDIEDGSDLRRGRPAVHKIYGEDISINAGNLLYFLALPLIDSLEASSASKLAMYQCYSLCMSRLHLGQFLDISWHRSGYTPGQNEYLQMCALKTGSLARASAELGLLLGARAENNLGKNGQLALAFERLGIAFQIIDDIKNVTVGNPGKKRGDDIIENKKSLLVVLAREFAHARGEQMSFDQKLAELFGRARAEGISSSAVEEAIGLIAKDEVLVSARAKANWIITETKSTIQTVFTDQAEAVAKLLGAFAYLGF